MLTKVPRLAAEYDMLPPGCRVLCALSGGADSICLVHLLLKLSRERGFELAAAHFDHRLRGAESRSDAAFAEGWCCSHQVPFYLGAGDVAAQAAALGKGVEETARNMRYEFLRATARAIGADRIATAHNADDNAETLLLHLIRGTGLRGLTGISPRRGELIRPLLTTSRKEILAYLDEHSLPHVEDSSNQDEAYTRNFLRHQVIPLLQQINPSLNDSLTAAARALSRDDAYLTAQAEEAMAPVCWEEGECSLPAAYLAGLSPALALRVIGRMGEALGPTVLSAAHREAVLALATGDSPSARTDLPGGLTALREYDRLVLTAHAEPPPFPPVPLSLPGQAEAGDYMVRCTRTIMPQAGRNLPYSFYLSCDKITGELTLRPRRRGDELSLPYRGGSKTLKKWMIQQHLPRRLRDRLPVLEWDGQVAGAAGLGPSAPLAARPGQAAWLIEFEKGCASS